MHKRAKLTDSYHSFTLGTFHYKDTALKYFSTKQSMIVDKLTKLFRKMMLTQMRAAFCMISWIFQSPQQQRG